MSDSRKIAEEERMARLLKRRIQAQEDDAWLFTATHEAISLEDAQPQQDAQATRMARLLERRIQAQRDAAWLFVANFDIDQ